MNKIWYKILMCEMFSTKFVHDRFSKQSKFLRFATMLNLFISAFLIGTAFYFVSLISLISLSVCVFLWFLMRKLYKSLQPYER